MAQLVTRVDEELAAAVDELVAAGVVANGSEAVRLGLQRLVDRHRRDQLGARIVPAIGPFLRLTERVPGQTSRR